MTITIDPSDPLKRPIIMDGVELTRLTYAYDVSVEGMLKIQQRDQEQTKLGRRDLTLLLSEVSDASSVGYYYNGHHVYFSLQSRHNTYESLQEVIDHVNMYMEGVDCHWITGDTE